MKKITAWETSDGAIHIDFARAQSHADRRYGDLLTALAHGAVKVSKYVEMLDWLESNAEKFEELNALRRDALLESDQESESC